MTARARGVVVVGAGPAGTACAAACAQAGLPTTLVGQDLDAPWPNTFGVWEDELEGLGLDQVAAHRWARPLVAFDHRGHREVDRVYLLLDNRRLRDRLRDLGGEVELVEGAVAGVLHDLRGSVVMLRDGRELRGAVVIDATGHHPVLAQAGTGRPPAFQVAYGVVARCSAPPIPRSSMVLMDWRDVSGADPGTPSFLYAMDLGGGRWFLEETSLAARPGSDLAVFAGRLEQRLDRAGSRMVEREAEERCRFPMGGPLPPRDQRIVAFGAAAGMVHPTTGYQVGFALRRAPRVARVLRAALAAGATGPVLAQQGWDAVWPADLRRQRALHGLGLETLLRFDQAQLAGFFAAFFDLPEQRRRAYLSGAPSAGSLAATMLLLLARAPQPQRAVMLRTGAGLLAERLGSTATRAA